MTNKKLFLTSWPSGQLILVDVLGLNECVIDGIYIRYPESHGGGTDTTTDKFLFDIPSELDQKE